MNLKEIREMPQSQALNGKTHESVFRSYHALRKVIELLRRNAPADVVLEIYEDLGYDSKGEALRERE